MRFLINQDSYLGDGVVTAGTSLEVPPLVKASGHPKDDNYVPPVWSKPGPHWKPLDEEATKLCALHKIEYTGEVPDPTASLSLQLNDALERARAAGGAVDYEKLGATVADGVSRGVAEAIKALLPHLNSGGAAGKK